MERQGGAALRSVLTPIRIALLLFLLNITVNAVLLLPGEPHYRESIEPGYAAMARFVAVHPNPFGWKPEQYCGLPTQFSYLPGMPYLAAFWIRLLPSIDPGQVYRVVTVTLACLGPVTVFLFILYFTKSRWWAIATALPYTFFSPFYLFVSQVRRESDLAQPPWRILILAKYGEAPHIVGVTLLPLAILAVWAAGSGRKYWQIVIAAAVLAIVALTNWIAALSLAWCCLMLLLSVAGTARLQKFRVRRVAAAVGLAYLLACFWLTPTFIRTTAFNWPLDSFNYHLQARQRLLIVGLLAGVLLLRLVFLRLPGRTYLCFLSLGFFSFTYVGAIYYWFGLNTVPESRRYLSEAELFCYLLFFELAREAVRSRRRAFVGGVATLGLIAFLAGTQQMWRYVTKTWRELHPIPKQHTVEYRIARLLADRHPAGRVYVTGSLRFHLNSWFDIPQPGGTFESGLRNRAPIHLSYQIYSGLGNAPGREGQTAIMQLKALGIEYVAVHGPESSEFYHDFRNPRKFEGLLERVYRQNDDSVYHIPFTSYAHLIRPEEFPAVVPTGGDVERLQPFVAALDDPTRPKLRTAWLDTNDMEIEGRVPEGMFISVLVCHDPGWIAVQDGRRIPLKKDVLDFMVLHPQPAEHSRIVLRYRGTDEPKIGAAISALVLLAAVAGLLRRKRWTNRER